MTSEPFDQIRMIEAMYALDLDERTWLDRLAGFVAVGTDAPWSIAMSIRTNGGTAMVLDAASRGLPRGAFEAARILVALPRELVDPLIRLAPRCSSIADLERLNRIDRATRGRVIERLRAFAEFAGVPPPNDGLVIRGHDFATERGTLLIVPREHGPTPPRTRHRWNRLAAHLAAATRLRALSSDGTGWSAPTNDAAYAVFAPSGRCESSEEPGKSAKALKRLRSAVLDIEGIRSHATSFDREATLDAWNALTSGKWSLVDRFETDGSTYVVAARNPAVYRSRVIKTVEHPGNGSESMLAVVVGAAPVDGVKDERATRGAYGAP